MSSRRRETLSSPEEWVGKMVQVRPDFSHQRRKNPRTLYGHRFQPQDGNRICSLKLVPITPIAFAITGEFILIIDFATSEQGHYMLRAVNARGNVCWVFPDEI